DARIEAAAGAGRGANPGMSEAIVEASLLGIAQNGVGLRGLFELLFRAFVAGVAIGVVLHRELPVGAFQLRFARVPRDPEDLVVVVFAHAFATFTIAGRSRRPFSRYPRWSSATTCPSRWPGLGSVATAWWRFGSKSAPTTSI